MNKIIYVILLFAILYFAVSNYLNVNKIDKLTIENATLSEDLKSKTTIYKDKIIYQTRIKEKIVTQIKYLPPESSAIITVNNNNETTLTVKSKGFCVYPAIQGIASETLQIGFGARLAYWNRYGLGVGISNEFRPYIYVDRRISDFIPFMQNTAIGVSYNGQFGCIVSVFF